GGAGAGLDSKALPEGWAGVPPVSGTIRRDVALEYEAMGEAVFRARLAKADPAAAARIAPGDAQRLKRAWEVYASTGRSLTDYQAAGTGALPAGSWRAVALEPARAALYTRCDARLAAMVDQGAVDEVRRLVARNLDPELPAM